MGQKCGQRLVEVGRKGANETAYVQCPLYVGKRRASDYLAQVSVLLKLCPLHILLNIGLIY